MPDPKELRKIILKFEYEALMRYNNPIIEIEPLSGEAPYIEEYKITFNISTYIDEKTKRDKNIACLKVTTEYPHHPPFFIMLDKPAPFHLLFWENGRWNYGGWHSGESLVSFIYRAAKTLQFCPEYNNLWSTCNHKAAQFWRENENNGIFSCDTQIIPEPEKPRESARTDIRDR